MNTSEPKKDSAAKADSTPGGSAAPNAAPAAGAAGQRPAQRHGPAVAKEIPEFEWKVVGYSQGVPLILFKSVEKEDAEGQYQRHLNEGYYTNLALHPIKKKISMPKNAMISPHDRPKAKSAKKTKKKVVAPKSKFPSRMIIRLKNTIPLKGKKKKVAAAKKTAKKKTKKTAKKTAKKKTATKKVAAKKKVAKSPVKAKKATTKKSAAKKTSAKKKSAASSKKKSTKKAKTRK